MRCPRVLLLAVLCAVFMGMLIYLPPSLFQATTGPEAGKDLAQGQIIDAFKKVSTGNIADAADGVTGQRGYMVHYHYGDQIHAEGLGEI